MRWNIGGTASGIQKMVFSQRTFNRACAFIVINKVWCFSHVWWYFFPSKDDLYLHIGMGFFSWWRVFGGVLWMQGLGQYGLSVSESGLGSEPIGWWELVLSPQKPFSHFLPVFHLSGPHPSHSQRNLWSEQVQRLTLGDSAVVNTWGITVQTQRLPGRADSEILVALPSCSSQAAGLEAALGHGQGFPSVTCSDAFKEPIGLQLFRVTAEKDLS